MVMLNLILLSSCVMVIGLFDNNKYSFSRENGFFSLSYGDDLSPRKIYNGKEIYSPYIMPNNNYASELTNLLIYFSLDDKDLNITNYEPMVYYPGLSYHYSCSLTGLGVGEWESSCTIPTIEEAGTYGPVSIIIRYPNTKQIYAQELNFGYFAVLGDEPDDGKLMVSFYSEDSSDVYSVEEDVILQFDIFLDVKMYFRDYFKIKIDSNFGFQNLEIEWVEGVDGNKYFNETMHNIYTYNDLVYIYGFNNELTEDAFISFRLSGFIAPTFNIQGNNFDFSLEIYRFGTYTMTKRYTGSGPKNEVVPGKIEIVTWAPVNSAISIITDLYDGLTTWFKLVIKTEHDIPQYGKIIFEFIGIKINQKTYISDSNQLIQNGHAAIYIDSSWINCIAETETRASCITSSIISKGTNIVLYNLITISSDLILTSATTKNEKVQIIDKMKQELTIKLPESGANPLYTEYARIASSLDDDTGVNTIMSYSANYGILVGFKLPEMFTVGVDRFTIYLPFSIGTEPGGYHLVMSSTASTKRIIMDSAINFTTDSQLKDAEAFDQTLGSGLITLSLASSGSISANKYFYAFIGSKSLGTAKMFLQKVPTRIFDKTEIVMKLKIGLNYYVYASPLYFASAKLAINPSLRLACRNPINPGVPVRLSFTPDAYIAPDSLTLKILLTITNVNLLKNTNLNEDDLYPGTNYKITSNGDLYISGLSSLEDTMTSLKIPLPAISESTELSLQVKIYLQHNVYEDNLVYSGESSYITTTDSGSTKLNFPSNKTINVSANYDLVITIPAGFTDGDESGGEIIDIFYILLFPYGYSTTDSDLDEIFTHVSRSLPYFYAYKTLENYEENTEIDSIITIKVPQFESITTIYLYSGVGSLTSSFNNIDCGVDLININTENASSLIFSSYIPKASKGYTYSNKEVTVTLTLKSSIQVLKGTAFTSSLDYWNKKCTESIIIGGNEGANANFTYPPGTLIIINLTGCDLPKIADGADSIIENGFISVTGTIDGKTYLYWQEPNTMTQTEISPNNPISGKESNSKLWVFPSVFYAVQVFFGISFTLNSEIPLIPAGSTIDIKAGFLDDDNLHFNLWANFRYSSQSISNGVLSITFLDNIKASSTLTIVKDFAFDLDTLTPDPVYVSVSADFVQIIQDVSNTQKYSVDEEPAGAIEFTVEVSENLAGYVSVHIFTLNFDTASSGEVFWVHLDASFYNANPGPTIEFEDLPGILFLYAYNFAGEFSICFSNHWVISCRFSGPIEVNSELKFSIWIKNPQEFGKWSIYITDDKLKYLYQAAYSSSYIDFRNDLAFDIDLYFAYAEFTDILYHSTHNLELLAFVNISATAGSNFSVVFPSQYDLTKYSEDTIKCDMIYNAANAKDDDEVIVILDDADCSIINNTVVFTLITDQVFTPYNWTYFTLYNLMTPEILFENILGNYMYNPNNFIYYSNQFGLLYSDYNNGIVSASFDNLNAAYAGFTESILEPLIVNSGMTLLVIPGTWNGPYEITSKSKNFGAESVELTWKLSNDFIKLDENSYSLDYILNVAYFWIGTPSNENILDGIYTIKWEIEEIPFDGLEYYYKRPRDTLVKVSRENRIKIALSPQDIYVPLKGWSMPFKLEFEKSEGLSIKSLPFNSIKLIFEENDDLELYFRPNLLVLDKDTSEGYVSILCNRCKKQESTVFSILVKGVDRDAFVMGNKTYSFISGSRYNKDPEFSIRITDVLSSEFKLSIESNQIGVVTWCMMSEQISSPQKSLLQYISYNSYYLGVELNSKDDLKTLKNKHSTKIKELEDLYDNYEKLTKEKLSLSRNLYFPAQTSIFNTGITELSHFTELSPKTNYKVFVYFDNFNVNELFHNSSTVTTLRTPSHALLDFTFTVSTMDKNTLKSNLKKIFRLPEANYNLDSFGSDRKLSTSKSVIVYSDINNASSAYNISKMHLDEIKKLTESEIEVTEIVDYDEDVKFEGINLWKIDNGIYIALNYSSSTDGSVICTIEGNGTSLTSDQIFVGENNNGEAVDQLIEIISAGSNYLVINFTDKEYSPYGTYFVSCIVCNDFPGIPDCSNDPVGTTYEYTGTENNNISGGKALSIIFATFFLFWS